MSTCQTLVCDHSLAGTIDQRQKYCEVAIMAEAVASQPSLAANNHTLSPMRATNQALPSKQYANLNAMNFLKKKHYKWSFLNVERALTTFGSLS